MFRTLCCSMYVNLFPILLVLTFALRLSFIHTCIFLLRLGPCSLQSFCVFLQTCNKEASRKWLVMSAAMLCFSIFSLLSKTHNNSFLEVIIQIYVVFMDFQGDEPLEVRADDVVCACISYFGVSILPIQFLYLNDGFVLFG